MFKSDRHFDSSGKSCGPFGWEQSWAECCQSPCCTKLRGNCWLPSDCCESLAPFYVSVFLIEVEDLETSLLNNLMVFRNVISMYYFILVVHLDFFPTFNSHALFLLSSTSVLMFLFSPSDMSNEGDWLERWRLSVCLVSLHGQLPVLPHDTDHFLAEGKKHTCRSEVSSLPACTKFLQ